MVIAICGEDAAPNKTGKVLKILRAQQRAVVEGFNLVKRHMRKSQDNPQGGVVEKEAPIAISNLRMYDAARDKAAQKTAARKAAPAAAPKSTKKKS
jgi:large subunit ribosomal protein L24